MTDFGGTIGRDWRDSVPWWPEEPRPDGPNVVVVVLDDVGFGQLGCYGSDLDTPRIDALAAEGIRLANFRTTALCSPTRACVLTGRNHHRNAMGRVADLAIGFPGYWGRPPRENGFLSEILRSEGYATYAVGKWHLTPDDEVNLGASRATWPLGRGFDRWYGYHGGETHQFTPALYSDNHTVEPPRSPEYHLSWDLANRAIEFVGDLRAVDGTKPFFLYLATGACHSPHQAPAEWIARFKGRFDGGWDAWREATYQRQLELGIIPEGTRLSERPPWVPAWESLDERRREVAARFMECFAAYLAYTDDQLGRVFDYIDGLGEETLIILLSDNGASAEGGAQGSVNDIRLENFDPAGVEEVWAKRHLIGGPLTHNNYPWGWTMAGNTPFKRWKREVHHGGVADPCIVRWKGRVTRGAIRHQFTHAIDIVPTVLELAGIEFPDTLEHVPQSRIDGTSFGYLLGTEGQTAPERHTTQHFEMLGSRAIYHEGWKAVTYHPVGPLYDDGRDPNAPFEDDIWELYHVAVDLSETDDQAQREPARLAALIELWWQEAADNDVLPLDNRPLWALAHPKPDHRKPREMVRYLQGGGHVPEPSALCVRNRPHTIRIELTVPDGGADGVLLAQGSALGGWSFHVLGGRPRYVHNLYGKESTTIVASEPLTPGSHVVEFRFTKAGLDDNGGLGGTGAIAIDGKDVGKGHVPHYTPSHFNGVGTGLTCGYEWGPAVGDGYCAPFRYSGTIERAELSVTGPVVRTLMAEFAAILSAQ